MNSPNLAGTVVVPGSTPTIGAIIGGVISTTIAAKVGDPVAAYAINSTIPALFAWLFHFVHLKFGTPE